MKLNRIPLVARLALAAVVGVVCGVVLSESALRALTTFQALFSQLVKFLVPLIILGFITPAIAETGRGAGRMLAITFALAYASTLFSGSFAYLTASRLFPTLLEGVSNTAVELSKSFPVYFTLKIPPIVDVVSALVLAFIVGLGISAVKGEAVYRAFTQFRAIVEWTLSRLFVPLLPCYILTVTAEITASGRLAAIAGPAVKVAIVCFVITLVVLTVQYALAGLIAGRNPFKAFLNMMPSYLTGWATCSSAATIPVSLRQVKKNDIADETVNLVVPLCANIHLAGSMANIVACAVAVMIFFGDAVLPTAFTEFILMMSIVAIASPGVPGGCVLAAGAFVDSTLGFTSERYALLVAFYMALDGMGTACNLTGDGAIALIVNKLKCFLNQPKMDN